MLGIYFSGTGNSRYALEVFLKEWGQPAEICTIEAENTAELLKAHMQIIFSYPVQYSSIPKILQDFIDRNGRLWQGKKIFVMATMGLFSGDGAGILARRLKGYGAQITGGLHLKMPDSIADVRALKRPLEKNRALVRAAETKIIRAVHSIQEGKAPQEGIGWPCRLAGLLGQRLYFGHMTKQYTERIKIDRNQCIGCGRCVKLCPMGNISLVQQTAQAGKRCTMCYRCINLCPGQAITLLGKKVVVQGTVNKYLP